MRKVSFILLAVLILFQLIHIPAVYAESDTTGPELISVSVNKTDINVGETLVVTIKASDALSGLAAGGYVDFRTEGGGFNVSNLKLQSDGQTLIGEIFIDKNCYKSGIYELGDVSLEDNSGNVSTYNIWGNGNQIPTELRLSISVINNEKTDWEGPVLQSVTVDKTEANAGDTLIFEARATDISGIKTIHLCLDWSKNLDAYLSPVEGYSDLFRGSIKIPDDVDDGVYSCQFVLLEDNINNIQSYMGNISPTSPDYLPDAARFSVRIHGKEAKGVTITNIQIEPAVIKQGDPITIKVNVDKGGNKIEKFSLGVQPVAWAKSGYGNNPPYIYMEEKEEGLYEATFIPPVNWPAGEYIISSLLWWNLNSYGWDSGHLPKWQGINYSQGYSDLYPTFNVSSIFSGTENISIPVGSAPFSILAGVAAVNNTEGDITNKIETTGSVDTSKAGVYLIKYRIPSTYKDTDYTDKQFYYYDFRWVGVTEVQTNYSSSSQTPLAVTSGNLVIGASDGDVDIERDGNNITFSGVMTQPGEYSITNYATSSTAPGMQAANFENEAMAQAYYAESSKATVAAVIDRSAPEVKAAWQRASTGAFNVSVQTSDVSGVAETKYMAGACSAAQCKSGGTAFTGTFIVGGYGKYTVYARDRLGYESVTVVNISLPTPSAYLYNAGVSAGTLSRAFSKTCYSYKVNLGENEGSTTITPVKEFDGATMTIAGKAQPSYTVNVANGKSATVKVKVTYGKTSHTYTFTVTRAKSTNNNLASLSVSAGSFDKTFDPAVTNYTLTLDENTKSTKITDTVAAPGLAKASPSSTTVTLSNGQTKVVKITVKAQSGLKKTYVITVTRAASTNATLKSLKTSSGKCPLSPAFSAGVANYTVTLPATTGSVTISAAAAGYKAVVYIDGKKKTSQKVSVASGSSVTVHIVVTAQAGNTMDYYVTVTRP